MKLLWIVCLLVLTACANKDAAYRNLYEGLKQREGIVNPQASTNQPAKSGVSYDQYQVERKKMLEKDAQQ